jgi:hypothetical protein
VLTDDFHEKLRMVIDTAIWVRRRRRTRRKAVVSIIFSTCPSSTAANLLH